MRLPNFGLKRKLLEPVRFEPVHKIFEAQVEIVMHQDVSGWAFKKEDRIRFSLSKGSKYTITESKAREFVSKGYASYVRPDNHQPISDDERAEAQSQVTVLSLGA